MLRMTLRSMARKVSEPKSSTKNQLGQIFKEVGGPKSDKVFAEVRRLFYSNYDGTVKITQKLEDQANEYILNKAKEDPELLQELISLTESIDNHPNKYVVDEALEKYQKNLVKDDFFFDDEEQEEPVIVKSNTKMGRKVKNISLTKINKNDSNKNINTELHLQQETANDTNKQSVSETNITKTPTEENTISSNKKRSKKSASDLNSTNEESTLEKVPKKKSPTTVKSINQESPETKEIKKKSRTRRSTSSDNKSD